ncbi:hypothetical protein UAW_00895 [Enterococcus haemoperoxidus ATCC BAA-382]|uniref:DUF5067 domain-containing protein n=1 Tax=Enterococcus haemoperoxidus ATCC BAA-382 TaxID=1158608 RepID=R2QT78_9ENTE|nr:DUF5067 domain-containing protein [Enterococcus haemoperoxidus]EOH99742.1 hypothetical protein UAW_00895 [Enterococcus haemoperoxidus ATCC BAA-382]EOT62516.1 hypothetical protein I583_01516 [Enterococcus haemoperoxidus ATCC BAA-382]OJG54373.1 hypothetical protein RV06_GL003041 [Enterococcus haemoperoxidus]
MKNLLSLGVLTLCSVTLAACTGNNNSTNEKKSEHTATSQKKTDEVYFKDDTLKIDMATLKILSTEVLQADESLYREKPQLAITYEVTNDSDELISASTVWIACMGLTQEGENTINKLTVGMTPQDEKFTEYTEHQLDDIKPGGTAKAVISYDLEDTETPVKLKANQGMAGKELGKRMINLK